MSLAKCIVPAPPNSEEEPFEISGEITVFDGAMIYSGRHPCPRLLRDGTLQDHLDFLKAGIPRRARSRERARARRSRDILREIIERIKRGEIRPIRRALDEHDQLDPVRTHIRTSDLARIAAERGEQPKYLRHLKIDDERRSRPATETSAREFALLNDEEASRSSSRRRASPVRERVKQALDSLYPDGVPDQTKVLNKVLVGQVAHKLRQMNPALPPVSESTILRAVGRKKTPKSRKSSRS